MNLDIKNWKEFRVGDLFKLQRGHTLTVEQKEEFTGIIPCVNGTIENNGVQCYLSNDIELVGFNLVKSPAISIVRVGNGGKTFVQTVDFYIADNAFALLPLQKMSIESMMFISTLLDKEQIKYSYGRTVTNEFEDTIIKLPVSSDGTPDWCFMDDYMRSLHHKPLTTKNRKGQALDFDVRNWGEFKVGDLFPKKRVKHFSAVPDSEGDVPFVSSTSVNNGISGMVNEETEDGNCITVSTNGDCFDCFYQPCPIVLSNDVEALYNNHINPYTALFIITVMMMEKIKWSYGRKPKNDKVYDTIIRLPVDLDGDPDWQFMEDYIKSLPYGDRLNG